MSAQPGGSACEATPEAMAERVGLLPAVGLDEVTCAAGLLTRVDRKYLITAPMLTAMLGEIVGSVAVLDIDGRRIFEYSSRYFDTDDFLCFRQHRQGRRRRFKVRTRTYRDSGQCMLEVKAVSPRGETVKRRIEHPLAEADRLTSAGRDFAADVLNGQEPVDRLGPAVRTDYRRTTLLDRAAGTRLTIDTTLRFGGPGGIVRAPGQTVVVETKTPGRPGRADLALRRLGVRPQSISKYCVGVALLHPELPANPWHRALVRHFGAESAGESRHTRFI